MNKKEALVILETMPEKQFQAWFKELPHRVRLMVRGGMVNWKEVLPIWYINKSEK